MSSKLFATRSRIWLGRLVGLGVLILIFVGQPPPIADERVLEAIEILGFALLVLASFGRVWCTAYIAGRKNRSLTTEGPYSVVRNPLYVFSCIGALGLGMAVENPILAALITLGFFAYYPFVVNQEETYLAQRFGEEFAEYKRRVPKWIPRLSLYHEPATMEVDSRQLRRGIVDAMWFVWIIVAWEGLELLREFGVLQTWF